MADLIGGAAVGLIFSELYKAVENLIEKTKKFSPHLKAITATVDSLKPVIDQIEKQNKELNLSNEETEKLKKIISDGIKLVGDCSKNPKWYRKASYTDKLTDLDEALKRQLEILKAQGLRDGKETLIRVTEIKKLINQLQASLLQASWLLLLLLIFVVLVSKVMFSVPGGVREQQLATSSASVPGGGIILSRPARLQLGYFVVWLFGKLLVYAVYGVFVCMAIGIVGGCVKAIQDQYRLGFSGLKLPEWDELRELPMMIVGLCMFLYLLKGLLGLTNWINRQL
ncbi:PREDICTED: uncharacterized protein LOC103339971 [Prunus mume]|uniref:Uncharacterized protein LOC103339971 n=1 Tax=Prunus mume TaxID=102107 RepID=A0ABM0PM22_PRUMU|nr:PREDICTED: uncharacterized protein LOC103339971 [Prunus mume]